MNISSFSYKMNIAASHNIKERDYWLNKLAGELIKSFFPYNRQTSLDDRHLDTVNFQFQGELFTNLIRFCNNSDNRLHMILAAGLVALLNKYTGEEDIIVGMPLYKQDIEGEFINTLVPLRNKLAPNMTFKQLLIQVRQTIFEAVEHQNYPMAKLMEKLKIPYRDDTGFGLFDVAVLLENLHEKYFLKNINNNIVFSFLRTAEVIESTLEYNAALYDKNTIKRIANHYQHLFRVAFSNPDIPLAEIDILTEEEMNQLLLDFNDTQVEYPQDKTIHVWLENQVEKTPDKIAVVYKHQYLTYQGLNEKSNQLAGLLREKDVKPGSIVGIIMEPCLELIIGIAGILKAGGAYLPIDSSYPENRILSILRDSGTSILLTNESITMTAAFTSLVDIKVSDVTPVVTKPRPQILDFDSLPFPDRTLIDYKKYHQYIGLSMCKNTVSIQASRGCPYNCFFCHKIWPKNHVTRSAGNVFEEIKHCYDGGIRQFSFIDDVFNLKKDNIARFMEKIIKNRLEVHLFFANGLRGDILTKEIIDLMVEAGTVGISMALDSASPRIQKLIRKNLNLEKFKENVRYMAAKYPGLLLELEIMIGFPTETEEEALMALEFVSDTKWIHFPNLNILKIYPNSEMYQLAIENGISHERIQRSVNLAYHHLPETLPFSKAFVRQYQVRLMNEYFLSKERLCCVLLQQVKTLTQDELVQKYDSYLPMKIRAFPDILKAAGISTEELGNLEFLPPDHMVAPGFRENMKKYFLPVEKNNNALRVLLLDLSSFFSSESESLIHHQVGEPLGLVYLLTYLNKTFGPRICGKIGKSRVDFDDFHQFKTFIRDFNPDLIGIRTLSYYKEFFHRSISLIRQWGINVPIITGGPYATSDYRLVLNDPNIDVVVLGEGELTFAQLIEKVMENGKKLPGDEVLKTIAGIAFIKKQDKIAIEKACREVIFLDNPREVVAPYPGENPLHVNQPGDLLYLISTSGSTGIPKSIMMEHRNLVNLLNFQFYETAVDFKRVLQFASIGFDASFQEIFSTLLTGGELYLIDRDTKQDVYRLLELIDTNQINVLFWPPAYLKYIFSEEIHRSRFPRSVQHIITAGEQLIITKSLREYIKKARIYVHNYYGPAETHVVTTLVLEPTGKIPELPPIGKPIANTRIYILDENKKPKPIGTIGELYIAGANLGRGYYRREELTTRKFIPNPFVEGQLMYRSGDLARWLPDGNIEFIGRVDYQVKIRGFRIELGEIETRLMEIDFIKEAVIVDYKNPDGERYLCAYFVSQKEVEVSEIKDILASELPDYMVPLYFVPLEKIPLNSNGKVDKKKLPLPEFKTNGIRVKPRNDVEIKLLDIWSEVLGIDKDTIGIDANFFEWGGHSLKATILISRIHQLFDVKMSLGEMFDQSTIRGLAALIKESAADTFSSIKPVEKKEYYPLFSAQKRLYILQQMDPDSIAYNLPRVVMLEGEVEISRLEKVFQELTNRHESLRTSFHLIQNVLMQKIHQEVSVPLVYWEMEEEAAREKVKAFIAHFDLKKAPLLRVGLIKTGAHSHILMVDLHHIITDGISNNVLLQDFSAIYSGEELPPIKLHYKDFSKWQNSAKEKKAKRGQELFWLQQFPDEPPVLNLPTDYPRFRVQSFEGSYISFQIRKDDGRALKTLALKYDATLYMVLLALYNIFLAKITNQEDIIIGTPVAGRRHEDLEKITGMFVNTLALRNFPSGARTVSNLLTDIRKRTLDAFENQEYPFEDLVEQAAINRDLSRNPLFNVTLEIQNFSESSSKNNEKRKIKTLQVKPYSYPNSTSKFDLSLVATEKEGKLYFYFLYCTKLFEEETILRFIQYFKKITSSVSRCPGKKISEIELISGQEKKRILYEFNDTEVTYSPTRAVHILFDDQVKRKPDNIAVLGPPLEAGHLLHHEVQKSRALFQHDVQLTYNELNEKSNGLACWLKEKGVAPGIIVGILAIRSIRLIAGILGILKAGAAYLPVDPGYPQDRVKFILADSNATILLDSPGTQVKVKEESPRVQGNNTMPSASDLAYVIYTSGSTGKPKGVMVEHRSVINLLYALDEKYSFLEKDTWLLKTACVFDVSITELFCWFMRGGKVNVMERGDEKDPQMIADTIARYQTSHINFVPSMFSAFAETLNQQDISQLSSLKYIFLAGEALQPETVNKFTALNNRISLENLYGPTEATVYASGYSLQDWTDNRNVPIGKPLPNVVLYITDTYNRFQPVGITGELSVSGAGVVRGYLNRPELTAEKFVRAVNSHLSLIISSSKKLSKFTNDQYPMTNDRSYSPHHPNTPSPCIPYSHNSPIYKTGDLARWLPDGNIEFLGRMDNQIKIRGFRIELEEIEKQLLRHDDIKKAVVIMKGNTKEKSGNNYLCAYLVTCRELEISRLRNYLSAKLPVYMIPSHFINIDQIPLTTTGKIDRRTLESLGENMALGVEYVEPESELEKTIAQIWKELLKLNKVGIHDNFFNLGGNSLNIISLRMKLKMKIGKYIPLVEFFRYPTIHSFAMYLEKGETPVTPSQKKKIKEAITIMEETLQLIMVDEK